MLIKKLSGILLSCLLLSACATSQLIDGDSHSYQRTTTKKVNLVNDSVVAFGKPSTMLPNMSANSIVIVGEKHSYVLTQGGDDLVKILSGLDPQYIRVSRELDFYSPKNDGHFAGKLSLTYSRLKDDFSKKDLDFMIKHNATECSLQSDVKMQAQRFCFDIVIQGGVYPAVNNLALIKSNFKPLSRPYQVSIYTETTEQTVKQKSGSNPVVKLALLPFALAFDVITLPVQLVAALD